MLFVSRLRGRPRGMHGAVHAMLFATHPQSALEDGDLRRGGGLLCFDYSADWRFVLEVEPVERGDTTATHNGDGSTALREFGRITLPIDDGPSCPVVGDVLAGRRPGRCT